MNIQEENMKISSLQVYNCKRIANIRFDITSHTQMILGSNMSGKSTLMRMLIPYPLGKHMFSENGYAVLCITQNNKRYLVTTAHDRYSLTCDGIELNATGKIGIQTKLVLEHFGITQKLTSLLLGEIKFTDLSEGARRDWSVGLSDVDYDYILGIYSKVRKDLTYAKNITKHQTEQLAEISVTDVELLTEQLDELTRYSKLITPHADYNNCNLRPLQNRSVEIHEKIDAMTVQIRRDLPEDLDLTYVQAVSEKEHLSKEVNRYVKNILELEQKLHTSVSTNELRVMNDKLIQLNVEQSGHKVWQYDEDVDQVTRTIARYGEELETFYTQDITRSKKELQTLVDQHTYYLNEYDVLQEQLSETVTAIDHLNHNSVDCPKCDHTFALRGGDLAVERNLLTRKKKDIIHRLKRITGVEDIDTIADELKYVTWIDQLDIIYPWGDVSLRHHSAVVNNIESHTNYMLYATRKEQLQQQINLVTAIDVTEHTKVINERHDAKQALDEINVQLKQASHVVSVCNDQMRVRDNMVTYAVQYSQLLKDKRSNMKDMIHAIKSTNACRMLDETNTAIRKLTADIQQHEHTNRTITTLDQQIAEGKKEVISLETLANILSPQKGYISHTLKEFQNYFVSLVNAYIKNIWTTPLTVYPPLAKQKYGVDCNGVSDDIKETSAGMQEILNLAFRLTIQHIALPDCPLMLDEVGVNLDETHRVAMYDYINHTLFNDYPNVFIISHYKDLYSLFTNDAEFAVLDSNNIDTSLIPCKINTGLTLQ